MVTVAADDLLVLQVGSRRCGIRLASVRETMRPLPVASVPDAPPGVLGVATIRGVGTPVVDLAAVTGATPATTPRDGGARFVLLRVGPRAVALAVDGVIGVLRRDGGSFEALPPLLQDDGGAVSALARRDGELVLLLDHARWLPDLVARAAEAGPP